VKQDKLGKKFVVPVIMLALFFLALNILWSYLDKTPPHWDMARHLSNSLDYHRYLIDLNWRKLIFNYSYYPPFYYWLTALWYLVVGRSIDAAISTNLFFVVALAISVYFSAKKLQDERSACLAALLALTFPMLSSQFKEFQLDAPLTVMVSLGLTFLLYSDNFRNRKSIVFLGIVSGLAMLTKWTYAAYVLVPLIYLLAESLLKFPRERISILKNALIAAIATSIIAGPWYTHNLSDIKRDVDGSGINAALAEGDPVGLTLKAFMFYFWTFIEHHFWLIGTIIFLVGLVVLLSNRESRRKYAIYLISVIVGYIIFSTFPNKDARFIMPIVPSVAIIIIGFMSLLPKTPRAFLAVYLIIFAFFTFFETTFSLPFTKSISWQTEGKHWINVYLERSYTVTAPSQLDWHYDVIVSRARSDAGEDRTIQFLGQDRSEFNRWALAYYSRLYGMEWVGENTSSVNFRYLVFREAGESYAQKEEELFREGFSPDVMGQWILPDGTSAYLIKIEGEQDV
jgi:4-amino-4-deoxy-L-arabinose transferase-like glycosyltransferase